MIQKFGNRVNWVPRGDINKIGKQYDERDWIDMIYNNESDEIYNIIEKQANKWDLEESETDERDQTENTPTFNKIGNQYTRENDDLVDTDTDLEHDTVHDTKDLENNINKNW